MVSANSLNQPMKKKKKKRRGNKQQIEASENGTVNISAEQVFVMPDYQLNLKLFW